MNIHFHPNKAPIKGQNSTVPPMGLAEGEFVAIENMRFTTGAATLRGGIQVVYPGTGANTLATALSGLSPVFLGGIWIPTTGNALIAVGTGGKTRIYGYDSYNDGWYEQTGTGTKYGTTRFSTATEMVHFHVVSEPFQLPVSTSSSQIYWVAQTGHPDDLPRVGQLPIIGGTDKCYKHGPMLPPNPAQCWAEAGCWEPGSTMSVQEIAAWMPSGLNLTGARTLDAAAGGNAADITIKAAVVATDALYGEWATAIAGSDILAKIDTSGGCQLQIAYKCAFNPWNYMAIELSETLGANPQVIWDPTDNSRGALGNPFVVVPIDSTYNIAAFNITPDKINSAHTYKRIRFIWKTTNAAPAADTHLYIYWAGVNIGIPGGTQFGVSYFNSASRAESPGVVCQSKGSLFTTMNGTGMNGARIPDSPLLLFEYRVFSPQPSNNYYDVTDSDNVSRGADYILTYTKPYGSTEFLLEGYTVQTLSEWSGANWIPPWIPPTGLSKPEQAFPAAYSWRCRSVGSYAYLMPRTLPDALCTTMPIGNGVGSLNTRSVVLTKSVNPSGAASLYVSGTEVWVSAPLLPFRFRPYIQYINNVARPDSPVKIPLAGGHRPMAVRQVLDRQYSRNSTLVFTDKSVFSVSGDTPEEIMSAALVSQHGTLSPMSVVQHQGTVVYLDSDMHVRVLGQEGFDTLDYRQVEDLLKAIPYETHSGTTRVTTNRVKWASGAIHDGRYYLAISPSGGTENQNVLVYDFRHGGWIKDKPFNAAGVGIACLMQGEYWAPGDRSGATILPAASGKTMLFAFGSDCLMYEYDQTTSAVDGASTAINILLETREFMDDKFGDMYLGRVAVISDPATGKTLTVTRKGRSTGTSSETGRILLTATNAIWRFDGNSSADATVGRAPLGISDCGVRYSVSGAPAVAGWKMYAMGAEMEPRDWRGDVE